MNDQVRGNSEVLTQEMGMEAAIEAGATALFGEKYGDEVRVLTMGTDRFSVELCGGTHVERTGDIGVFRVVSEGGVAAGVRRIEAVTGVGALEDIAKNGQSPCGYLRCSQRLARKRGRQSGQSPKGASRT